MAFGSVVKVLKNRKNGKKRGGFIHPNDSTRDVYFTHDEVGDLGLEVQDWVEFEFQEEAHLPRAKWVRLVHKASDP